jgi:DHA1 family bicyclomycin/chloramphenicol resistance-like MFS transporter
MAEPTPQASPSVPHDAPFSAAFLTGYITVLFAYGWLSVNIYLPILPELEHVFDTSTRVAKLTVAVFLLAFACSQLVWGPLSDHLGRKPVLLVGLGISAVAAVLSGLAPNVELFVAARTIEALALGVGPVLGRAVLTDTVDRAEIATILAYVVTVVALVPALAPILGGYLALWLSWSGIFFAVAVYGAAVWLLTLLSMRETLRAGAPRRTFRQVIDNYRTMLRNGRYSAYLVIYGVAFGSLLGYYATTPYLFTRELGYTSYQYGYLLIFNVVFYIAGAQISRRIVRRAGVDRPILFAMIAYATSTVAFFVVELFVDLGTLSVLIPISIYIFGAGLVSPAANAGAMTLFLDRAGAAAAFVGFAISIGGALFSGALAHVHVRDLWQLGVYVAVITLVSSAIYFRFLRASLGAETPA